MGEVLSRASPVCVSVMTGCRDTVSVGYFAAALARSPSVWLVVAFLLASAWSLPSHQPWVKRAPLAAAFALGHATVFFGVQGLFYAALVRPGVLSPGDPVFVPAYVAWVAFGGYVLGLGVSAAYLLGASWFGANHNELFAAMRLGTYKCVLRLALAPDGKLTVYPLGIERPPRVPLTRRGRLRADALRTYRVAPVLIEDPFTVVPRSVHVGSGTEVATVSRGARTPPVVS
jgi:hypothetical protein